MNKFDDALQAQKEEMERYRWTESEKAGYDVGKPIYIEWIKKFAAQWRENWTKNH